MSDRPGRPLPSRYPNIEAIAAGCISGDFSEWPAVRPEARALLARLAAVEDELARLKDQVIHDPATCHVCRGFS